MKVAVSSSRQGWKRLAGGRRTRRTPGRRKHPFDFTTPAGSQRTATPLRSNNLFFALCTLHFALRFPTTQPDQISTQNRETHARPAGAALYQRQSPTAVNACADLLRPSTLDHKLSIFPVPNASVLPISTMAAVATARRVRRKLLSARDLRMIQQSLVRPVRDHDVPPGWFSAWRAANVTFRGECHDFRIRGPIESLAGRGL